MYLGVDIGGTKTLVALFNHSGELRQKQKFPTAPVYEDFLQDLAKVVAKIATDSIDVVCVAIPGRVDRSRGLGVAFGNLPWKNVPIRGDVEKMIKVPVLIEHDVNLAGLSEALLIKKEFNEVLYVTISTGIGTSIITDGTINPKFADSEGGHMMLNYRGKLTKWENFASGKAIVARFGQPASAITDESTWRIIAKNIAIGLIDLIAVIEPPIIVFGGGVGKHFNKYSRYLRAELKKLETPLTPVPVLRKAKRPEEAVIYGCYNYIKQTYEKAT